MLQPKCFVPKRSEDSIVGDAEYEVFRRNPSRSVEEFLFLPALFTSQILGDKPSTFRPVLSGLVPSLRRSCQSESAGGIIRRCSPHGYVMSGSPHAIQSCFH